MARTLWLDTPGLESGVDFLGRQDAETKALVSAMKTWHSRTVSIGTVARGLQPGKWAVYVDRMLVKTKRIVEKSDSSTWKLRLVVRRWI